MWLAWPPNSFPYLLFIGFVPLLWIEDQIHQKHGKSLKRLLPPVYLAFLIWNLACTWWLSLAGGITGIMASVLNAVIMCIPFSLFHATKVHFGRRIGYISLLLYWIGHEYLHHNWELSWTWLSLGNGFSKYPALIQFYEYTGIFGGSFWILLINIFVFIYVKDVLNEGIQALREKQPYEHILFAFLLTVFLGFPIALSTYSFYSYKSKGKTFETVVVQPNIDPYSEKFGELSYSEQLDILIDESKKLLTHETKFLVWPETSFAWIDENSPEDNPLLKKIYNFLASYPETDLISGINSYKEFKQGDTIPETAYQEGDAYYENYNTAILTSANRKIIFYHKSKLVPGVENIPYTDIFPFMRSISIELGGSGGGYVKQKERTVFESQHQIKTAALICYESVFGEYVTDFVNNGANAIIVVTNDGWWGNTDGHKQHLYFSSLRAIENRRSIARSANTGISCFIDERGAISQPTKYWERDVIKGYITSNSTLTFYTRHGDYIGRLSLIFGIMVALILFVSIRTHRYKYRV